MPRTPACVLVLAVLAAGLASPAPAQTLDQWWPHADGLDWSYDGHYEEATQLVSDSYDFAASLTFAGTNSLGGETVQNLVGSLGLIGLPRTDGRPAGLGPVESRLWLARADLQAQLAARAGRAVGDWPLLLLHPADSNIGFLADATSVGDWRDEIAARSWLYFSEPLTTGPNFTLQLVPDLATDVFLTGTISDTGATVQGPMSARSFDGCGIVEYTIDYGEATQTDEQGTVLGTYRMVTTGWVAFSSGIGPVAMTEQTEVVAIDCPACPFELGDVVSQGALELTSASIPAAKTSWSELKGRY